MEASSALSPSASRHPYHVYLVEDDAALREMLAAYLERQGVEVTAMASAEEMGRRIHRLRPDVLVMDVALPGESGLDACQRLRAEGDRLPIVLLSARNEEIDRVLGFEMGADDYVVKPFSSRELLARLRALLRRAASVPGLPAPRDGEVVLGEHTFVPATRSLLTRGEVRVLSSVEHALLTEFVRNPHVPISRERLLAVSHQRSQSLLARTVDVAVMRLRKMIEPEPGAPRFIQTVRGHGYMYVPQHVPSLPRAA